VQRVSEQLVRIFDPQQLLDEIMTIVVEQTGADRGLLCLLDDKRQPVPIAARGIKGNERVCVSRTVLSRLLNERAGVLINVSPDDEPTAFKSLMEMQVHSTMCAPLWTGDRIVGILSLDSVTGNKTFSQQDLDLLLAVAHPVAVGIERNRLSHQIDAERQVRDYMSKYLDHRVVEQISQGQHSGIDPLAPTESEVTILFSDIVSFTKMSESLSAVELSEFMRKYLTSMTDVIFSNGGTIDKYIGDAVMALFGAPVPSDDSAASAIRAALAMQARIKDFELPGAKGKALRVRVGINTGPVVVGNLGSERRSEYTALGDAVNVASRLETFARPNEICIDEHTYEKTKHIFDFEEIGTIDVKNRAEPVAVYRVMGERHSGAPSN
jgi:adenylate cyclase